MLPAANSLKSKVIVSTLITVVGFGSTQFMRLLANLILARILFPEAFGIMAIVNVVMMGLAMFSDVGIIPAIIQSKRGEEPVFLNTAWSVQIARGFILWLVACLIAWPAALLYGQDILFPMICVAGLTAIIEGFQSTAVATAPRNLQLARLTLVRFIGQLSGIVLMIVLAWLYQSMWALVIGALFGAAVETILTHLLLPSHKHKLHIEKEALEALFSFGQWIFLATVVTFLGGQGIRAIQGVFVSTETLGLISIASALATIMHLLTFQLVDMVIFPALSKISRDEEHRMQEIIARTRNRLLAASLPVFFAIAFASGFIIDILYDDRYTQAGAYLAILSISGAIEVLPLIYMKAYQAEGNSRFYFVLFAVSTFIKVAAMIIGYKMAGTIGMLAGLGVGAFLGYLYVIYHARKAGWISIPTEILLSVLILANAWGIYAFVLN